MTTKTLPDSTTAAYYYNGSGVTLVNAGVQGKPGVSGINFGFVVDGNNDTLINNGTVFGQRVGVYVKGSGDTVINAAGKDITATVPGQAGVNFYYYSGTVTNYGTISGVANAAYGEEGNAVEMRHGGLVTNFGTLQDGGALFRLAPGTLVNSGVILGNAAYGGVYMEAGGTVTNLAGGLISANGATESYGGAPPYGVFIVGGSSTITNAGTIDGGSGNAVLLASGFQNRVIVDPGAVFVGTVNGGTAIDATLELASGASRGTLSGIGTQFVDFGTITFDPSASWLVNANTSIASAVITGFGTSDTIQISGHETVSGQSTSSGVTHVTLTGASPMTLNFQGSLSGLQATYSGGVTSLGEITGPTLTAGGTVTFTGGGAAVTLDPGLAITNASSITGATVAIGSGFAAGDQLNFNNTLGITGTFFSATGILELTGTASATDYQAALDSITFSFSPGSGDPTDAGNHASRTIDWTVVDASGSATGSSSVIAEESSVLSYGETIDETGIVAASETVSAGVMTLKNAGGTSVGTITVGSTLSTNFFTLTADGAGGTDIIVDTVFGTYASGVTLLTNPTTIASTGKVTNAVANGKAVSGPSGTNWTLTNFGQVTETASNGIGISFAQSGTITNASGGTITAAGNAITLAAGGFVTNASGGTITGAQGVDAAGAAATVINTGRIGATGAGAAGVQVADGGQVTNQSGGIITGYSGVLGEAVTTVVNAGSIGANLTASGALGVVLFGSGAVTNLSGGIITGDYGVAITALGTLVNAGTITGNGTNATAAAGFYASGGGLVTNQSGGVITGFQGVWAKSTALTVQNAGSIGGNASVGNAAGVYLDAGGSVTNQSGGTITGTEGVYVGGAAGTVLNAGYIDGTGTDGVLLAGGGTITNQAGGTIKGSADAVSFASGHANRLVIDPGATFIGTVDGGNTIGAVQSSTLELASGASAGTLSGLGTQFVDFAQTTIDSGAQWTLTGTNTVAAGATLTSSGTLTDAGTLTNAGMISGGVLIAGDGVVTNAGTIASSQGTAGNAVVFGSGNATLIDDPGAAFTGSIVGGTSGTSTLELASSSSAGTITGFGSSVVNLTALDFDAGAQWTVAGNDSASGLGTLAITGFTGGDTIDLTGFDALSRAWSGGALVLTDEAGAHETLHIQGSFSTSSFLIASDGSGGTDITEATAPPTYAWVGGSADWNTPTNWSSGIIPGVGASATISDTGSNTVTIGAGESIAVADVTLSAGNTLQVSGTLLPAGTLGVTAATVAVVGTGTISGGAAGVTLYDGGNVITNQGTISGAQGIAVTGTAATGNTIIDSGTILGTDGTAISLGAGDDLLQFQPGDAYVAGTVSGGGGTNTLDFASGAGAGTLTGANADFEDFGVGMVAAGASWTLAGTDTLGSGITLTNSGTLFDAGTLTDAGTISGVITLDSTASQLTVIASGYVGNGGSGDAIYASAAGTAVNYGHISASGTGAFGAYGIALGSGGDATNYGSITSEAMGIAVLGATGTATNAGYISAGVRGIVGRDAPIDVTNSGTIKAGNNAVVLSSGGNVTNSGTMDAGDGVNIGGAIGTVANTGTIIATLGGAVDLGGGGEVTNAASGLINATSTYDAIYIGATGGSVTNAGTIEGAAGIVLGATGTVSNTIIDSGTIIGTAGTAIAFSGGGDLLQFQPGNLLIQGTVDGGGGTNTLEFASGASAGTLTGSGAVFTNFADGTIDAGANWTLAGTVTLGANVTVHGSGFLTDAGTLVNAGDLVLSQYKGLNLGAGSSFTNLSTGTISVASTGDVTAVGIYSAAGGSSTITNLGTIEADAGDGDNSGILLMASGTITNGGPTATSALIRGQVYGIGLLAGGSVTNYGTITASGVAGVVFAGTSTITNAGDITGFDYGVAEREGSGAMVVNTGTISGIQVAGIYLGGGTVIDSGLISGADVAVAFGGTANGLLVLEAGYALHGDVIGSSSTHAAVELLGSATAAVAATYNSLGLVNVGTVGFAASAANYATLVITNDGTLPQTIANFVGLHETIDLTALNDAGNDAVTSFNSATDQLTVTAGTASVTLQLDSEDYSGLVFVARQDGSGTAITPFTTAPPSIGGTTGGQAIDDAETTNPFASASIADANGTLSQSVTITLSDGADGVLSGTGLTETAPGVYSFTAADAADATTLLDSLVFTPTAHQVAPDDTVTTSFTVAVTNGIGESASDSTTSVAVTALVNAPGISGTLGGQGVPNQTTITPFASVTVTDLDVGAIDTATVSFDPADGTLSNLGGYVSDGTYIITGAPEQVTTALDVLTFTPAAPASGYIDGPAAFGLTVTGAGGTASNDATSVTAATQVLGLATLSASQVAISVSPDGSAFGQPSEGLTNEAIVTAPVAGGSYTLPGGYQAEFLAGSVSATLSDASVGGAILVGNTGNDTLIAAAANDSIEAGNGNNVLVGGSGQVAIAAGDGDNTISLASDADYTVSAGNGSDTIFAAGSGSIAGGSGSNVFVALGGANVIRSQGRDFISAAAGNTTVQASGNGVRVLGGAVGSTLVATITGSGATVSAADSAATVVAGGNDAVLFGGGQTAAFIAAGQADTIAGGAGATRVTVTGNDGVLLGGAGSLNAVVQGTGATIGGGAGAATVSVQTSALMFGNAGPLLFQGGSGVSTLVGGTGAATISGAAALFGNAGSNITYLGAAGGATYLAGAGSETIDASGSSANNLLWGSASTTAHDVMRGGSGSDTLVAGAGAATLSGGAGANTFVFFHADAGGSSVITDFSAADDVVLSGYAAGEAGTALQTATSAAGATALTLSDGTRITFLGIASASTLQGHLI